MADRAFPARHYGPHYYLSQWDGAGARFRRAYDEVLRRRYEEGPRPSEPGAPRPAAPAGALARLRGALRALFGGRGR